MMASHSHSSTNESKVRSHFIIDDRSASDLTPLRNSFVAARPFISSEVFTVSLPISGYTGRSPFVFLIHFQGKLIESTFCNTSRLESTRLEDRNLVLRYDSANFSASVLRWLLAD
jgi:hypothetical protein